MNKYTLEEVLKDIDIYFKDEFKEHFRELAKLQYKQLSHDDWFKWVDNFIP